MAETGRTDDLLRRLLTAVAADDAPDERHVERLIADARAEAEAEIRQLVKSAYKALLLRRATEQLEALADISAPAKPATKSPAPEPVVAPEPLTARQHSMPAPAPTPPPQAEPERRPLADDDAAFDAEADACYVYAITPATPLTWPDDVSGIDLRRPLQVVTHDDVQAIVSPVSFEEFGQAALDERVTDPQWVEEKVRAHDQVIKQAMSGGAGSRAGTVIPCRFCTVLRSAHDVRALLAANYDGIAATLASLRGKQEWGVKMYADLAALARQLSRHGGSDNDAAASGKSYLERKRREDTTRSDGEHLAREQADECHTTIAAVAADATTLPRRPRGRWRRG